MALLNALSETRVFFEIAVRKQIKHYLGTGTTFNAFSFEASS